MKFFSIAPSFPLRWYVLRMWLFSFFPTIFIVVLAATLFDAPGRNLSPARSDLFTRIVFFFSMVVVAPVGETLLLAGTIAVVSRFKKNPHIIAVISALLWAVLHSTEWLLWGVFVMWGFYLMSRIYLAWRPLGFWRACFVVTLVHAAHNFLPGVVVGAIL